MARPAIACRGTPGGPVTGLEESGPGEGEQDPRERRPLPERLGMAGVAAFFALVFAGIAVASWSGGDGFLAVMAGAGAAMSVWAGATTILRG